VVTEFVNRKYFPGYCTLHSSPSSGKKDNNIEY
jgi:hypothetical protein